MNASAVAEAATLPTGVVWTFGRNVGPFRYGCFDERVSGSGSGDASEMGVEGTLGRNVGTFRYGSLR